MDTFVVVDVNGDRFPYDAAGPQDALEQHYALDSDGLQPFVVGVFLAGNGWVGMQ